MNNILRLLNKLYDIQYNKQIEIRINSIKIKWKNNIQNKYY